MHTARRKHIIKGKRRETSLRKKPSQQRSKDKIERMLAAAAVVLEEEGYDAFKTVTIADRAGVAVGSVYQFFPNKHAILTVLVERWLAADNQALRKVEERRDQYETVVDEFVDLTKIMLKNYQEQRALLAIVSMIQNIPELYVTSEGHDKQYAQRLTRIIDRHGLKADVAEKLALAGYFTIIVDAAAISIALETRKRAELKTKFILNSVRDLFPRYL